jgi:hypothetical protein
MSKRLLLRPPLVLAVVAAACWALATSADSRAISPSGQIVVEKVADPADGTLFPFEVPWIANGQGPDVLLAHGQSAGSGSFAPGSYTVCEGNFEYDCKAPDGWQLTNIECDDPDGGTTTNLAGAAATIDLDDGETITCTFSNEKTNPVAPAQLTDTTTTCSMFAGGGAPDLTRALYNARKGTISSVAPGVFYYYSLVTAPASSFTIDVEQAETHPTFGTLFGVQQGSQVRLYKGDCTSPGVGSAVSVAGGQAHVSVTGATPGQAYIVSVKYSTSSVIGQPVPSPTTVHYTFATRVNGSVVAADADGFDLLRK